ncbi:MAG TPA: sulfite exporter TauE/SafE family protein [Candidatus Angelobacter sp.]
MVGTILPIVYGKRDRKPLELVVYSVGSILGGICCGIVLGMLSPLAGRHAEGGRWLVGGLTGLVAITYALKEAGLVNVPSPQRTWQVQRGWMRLKPIALPAGMFGFCLGLGLLTRINSCLYPVVVWIVLTGSVVQGALVMGAFGLIRTLPLWIMYGRSLEGREHWKEYTETLGAWQPVARLVSACILIVIGALFLAPLRF